MPLRLMQIVFPETPDGEIEALLADCEVVLPLTSMGGVGMMQLLVPAEAAEALMDRLEQRYGQAVGFRVILFPLEAIVPRPEAEPVPAGEAVPAGTSERVGREELYADISESVRTGRVFYTMVVLATVVAAIGLLRDNVAVIIGAMVIAPLLGPNVALALATTLGDGELARRALLANLKGLLLAACLSITIGAIVPIDLGIREIASRTELGISDLALALAAGAAGTMAFTSGASASLIGVMVAVALMPPLVVAGMLLGAGQPRPALAALALVAANVICVNLAGVAAFLSQGVGPRAWWEAEKARRHARKAGLVWLALLVILILILAARG